MSADDLDFEPLGRRDRSAFHCGVPALDAYFRRFVGRDTKRSVTFCTVAIERATGRIAGFHTLAAGSVLRADLPDELAKRLPRYETLPVILLGRLAVDADYRGQGVGGWLLVDVFERVSRLEVGAFAIMTEPKDEAARSFYRHFGFVGVGGSEATMMRLN